MRLSLFLLFVITAGHPAEVFGAELAMGFRVGEVTHHSAILWTRVTKNPERNWNGVREPSKRTPRVDAYVPSPTPVEKREGATPGRAGQLRVTYGTRADFTDSRMLGWVDVRPGQDFTHQFQLEGLRPATRHYVKIEARDAADQPVTAVMTGSFGTPAMQVTWQDATFAVVTGQSYWDLDDPQGYHIYPAMQALDLDFLVPTGDTVYLDSESPRARTVPLARYHWQRMYSLPRLVEFHRLVPSYWEKDDHDAWCNDCWPTLEAKWMNPLTFEEGLAIFREQVPMGKRTFRTVRWGSGLQVWMVEGRDFRSPNDMPDGPDKTIWGKEQLAWLKRTVLASDAAFRVLISPTPIVGPDRPDGKADNHSNKSFAHEGSHFRNWTRAQDLNNFFVCCGDRHWQYMSIDPETKLREFSCGPASDEHAGGSPGQDPNIQPFHRLRGGFLSVSVRQEAGVPTIHFRHHDVRGEIVHEFVAPSTE
jgi:alkaline phosphatase D